MKIENDKYYTPKDLAKRLIDTTFEVVGRENITEVIEPSAGNGSFSSQLPGCLAFDIKPEAEGIKEQDYLTAFLMYKKGRLIIGNPPFGTNSALAIEFYKRSVEIADYIAFVLPVGFLNNTIKLYEFDLIHSEDLGEKDYSGVNLHCCFNIYKRPSKASKGLNPKPDFRLKDVTLKEYRRGGSYKEPPAGFDYSLCNWGNGSLGKTPEYVGQYAQEVYVYINNEKFKDQILDLLSFDKLRNYTQSVSMKRISVMKLYKYLKENIDGIE